MLPWVFGNLAAGNQAASKFDDNFNALLAWAIAGGSANAITASYTPANTVLNDGLVLSFRATAANSTTTPTFSPDGLTAHTITKRGGGALVAGDIAGSLAEYSVRYNLANTRWELLNPSLSFSVGTGLSFSSGTLNNSAAAPHSYLSGLTLSTAGSSGTMSIAAGQATDSTQATTLLIAAFTKTTSAFSAGTGNGGLDTGSISTATWYHFYLIGTANGALTDILISLSATAPTMPATYTLKRRIGSGLTDGSSHWVAFIQDGDLFQWLASVLDIDVTNPGTAAVTRTLASVPTGVNVQAMFNYAAYDASAANAIAAHFSDLAVNDEAASITATPLAESQGTATNSPGGFNRLLVRTNTSAQIRSRMSLSSGTSLLKMATLGWVDRRGRDA